MLSRYSQMVRARGGVGQPMAAQVSCETYSNKPRRTHSAENCCAEMIGPPINQEIEIFETEK